MSPELQQSKDHLRSGEAGRSSDSLDLSRFRGRRVIIYGAGKIGRRVHSALDWFGLPVACFWDLRAGIISAELGNPPVLKPDFHTFSEAERDGCVVIVTIFSENVAEKIRCDLLQAGYTRVVTERAFINKLLYAECASKQVKRRFAFNLETCHLCPVVSDTRSRCNIFDGYVQRHFVRGLDPSTPPELLVPSVGVLISNKCTLTCVGCNHLRDHYRPIDNVDIPADRILADLDKFLSAVDLVNKLVVVGGESMLHPEIWRILDGVLKLSRVGVVHIITNGTVVLKNERVFELLATPRVIVEISDYGDHVPVKLQRNMESFISQLASRDIHYRCNRTLQWFDFGGFEHRGYSAAELKRIYATCCFISHDIFDGRLFKCSRSAYGTFIGKVPAYPADYVDIRTLPIPDLRRRVKEFLAMDHAAICQHCNGTSTLTIGAGRQVEFMRKANRPTSVPEVRAS